MNYNELIKTLEIDGKKVSEKYIAVFNSILKEKLIEKDNKIKKLKEENEKFKQGEIIPISVAEKSFEMRDQQLEIYKKALELVCETVVSQEIDGDDYFDVIEYWKYKNNIYDDEVGIGSGLVKEYFLQKAKEKINEQEKDN